MELPSKNESLAELLDLYNTPRPDAQFLSKLVAILFQFRNIPDAKLDEIIQLAKEKVFQHLKQFSLSNSDHSVNNGISRITIVGHYGAKLLTAVDLDFSCYNMTDTLHQKMTNSLYSFQECWMNNVGLLIPDVPQILSLEKRKGKGKEVW